MSDCVSHICWWFDSFNTHSVSCDVCIIVDMHKKNEDRKKMIVQKINTKLKFFMNVKTINSNIMTEITIKIPAEKHLCLSIMEESRGMHNYTVYLIYPC